MTSLIRSACLVFLVGYFWLLASHASENIVSLGKTQTLLKIGAPSVTRVVPAPSNFWAVAAFDPHKLDRQGIFIVNTKGDIVRKIGEYGQAPGMYSRLADILVDSKGEIWSTDYLAPRISIFAQEGRLVRTILLPGLQYLRNMWLDEPAATLFLSGCHNTNPGDTLSPCDLLQQVNVTEGKYARSFVPADPRGPERGFYRYVKESMAHSSDGYFWVAEAPFLKVYRCNPQNGSVRQFTLKSALARPPESFPHHVDVQQIQQIFNTFSTIDQIACLGDLIVVSVHCPDRASYILEILDKDGDQIGTDVPSPGRLVGQSASGALYFAKDTDGGSEIDEAKPLRK